MSRYEELVCIDRHSNHFSYYILHMMPYEDGFVVVQKHGRFGAKYPTVYGFEGITLPIKASNPLMNVLEAEETFEIALTRKISGVGRRYRRLKGYERFQIRNSAVFLYRLREDGWKLLQPEFRLIETTVG